MDSLSKDSTPKNADVFIEDQESNFKNINEEFKDPLGSFATERDPEKPNSMTARKQTSREASIQHSTPEKIVKSDSTPREATPPHISGRLMSSLS